MTDGELEREIRRLSPGHRSLRAARRYPGVPYFERRHRDAKHPSSRVADGAPSDRASGLIASNSAAGGRSSRRAISARSSDRRAVLADLRQFRRPGLLRFRPHGRDWDGGSAALRVFGADGRGLAGSDVGLGMARSRPRHWRDPRSVASISWACRIGRAAQPADSCGQIAPGAFPNRARLPIVGACPPPLRPASHSSPATRCSKGRSSPRRSPSRRSGSIFPPPR